MTVPTKEFSPCVVPQSYVALQQAFFPYPDLNLQNHIKIHANQILSCLKPFAGYTRFHAKIRAIVINCQGNVDPNFRLNNPFALFYELFLKVRSIPKPAEPAFQIIKHCVGNQPDQVEKICSSSPINLNCCYLKFGSIMKNTFFVAPILSYSCRRKLTNITVTLLKHGANPRLRHFNMDMQTPMFHACSTCEDAPAQITALLDAGVDPNEEHADSIEKSPSPLIESVSSRGDSTITYFLAFNGAKITAKTTTSMQFFCFTHRDGIASTIGFSRDLRIQKYAHLVSDLTSSEWKKLPLAIIKIILGYYPLDKDALTREDWKAISTELCKTFKIE